MDEVNSNESRPPTPRLIRIDAGCWVRSDTITALTVIVGENPPRAKCWVHHGDSEIFVICADNDAHAIEIADNIAAETFR